MGKQSVASKPKSRQGAKESDSKDFEKELKKCQREETQNLNAELKKIAKLDFEGFKKAMIAQLKLIHKALHGADLLLVETTKQTMDWTAEDRDKLIETIGEKLHERDDLINKAFESRDERLEKLESIALMQWFKLMTKINGKTPSHEAKKEFCEYLGYDWDKTVDNLDAESILGR